MNGRLYDPQVGRMFSPDPYIPDGTNSQDYNKYIYARNNPLKYTDPDGEWVQIVVGAVVGGVVNLGVQAIKGNVNTFGQGLKYFGVGAVGGALASVTGGAATGIMASMGVGGFVGGAASGAASGFAGGFVGGAGNAWVGGANFGDGINAGLKSGAYGAAGGAILGGISGGIKSARDGYSFWNGRIKTYRLSGVEEEGDMVAGGDDIPYTLENRSSKTEWYKPENDDDPFGYCQARAYKIRPGRAIKTGIDGFTSKGRVYKVNNLFNDGWILNDNGISNDHLLYKFWNSASGIVNKGGFLSTWPDENWRFIFTKIK